MGRRGKKVGGKKDGRGGKEVGFCMDYSGLWLIDHKTNTMQLMQTISINNYCDGWKPSSVSIFLPCWLVGAADVLWYDFIDSRRIMCIVLEG